ncbi:Uncharacterised protein [Vibrio cholerae]|nr:Uncharacterised protein [Vibrio cholerae]
MPNHSLPWQACPYDPQQHGSYPLWQGQHHGIGCRHQSQRPLEHPAQPVLLLLEPYDQVPLDQYQNLQSLVALHHLVLTEYVDKLV